MKFTLGNLDENISALVRYWFGTKHAKSHFWNQGGSRWHTHASRSLNESTHLSLDHYRRWYHKESFLHCCWCLGSLHPQLISSHVSKYSNISTRARILSLPRSKLRLCLANYRAVYFSNLDCDWLSIVWAYSEQETENGPRGPVLFLNWLRFQT